MANRFKKARTEYNKHGHESVKDVSKATGITSSLIDDLEFEKATWAKLQKAPRDVGYSKIKTLAEHYGVSTDYLLELSDYPTINAHAAGAAEYTGLSLEAINRIVLETTPHPGFTIYENNMDLISVLNLLLTSTHFWGLVNQLSGYINSPKRKTSRAAEISREFHEVNHGANRDDEFNQRDIFGYRAVREFNSLLEELDKNEREAKDDGEH